MALFSQHKEELFHWGIWKVDEPLEELLTLLPNPDTYTQELHRFSSSHRQQEWLAVRVLLYQLLGQEKQIVYSPTGKPSLEDNSHLISISHTPGYVAVILCSVSAGGIGIDIEQYGQRVRRVAPKFMAVNEVCAAYQGDDTWGLLLHWSAKEVMFKCINTPEVDFRAHLHIAPFEVEQQGTFCAQEYRTDRQQQFTIHYLIHPHFVMTYTIAVR